MDDYRQELIMSLSSARELAAKSIQAAQRKYKRQFDKKARPTSFKIGGWVLVLFPHELTGKNRKLSRPWHGPYCVTSIDDPDISVSKVYFPQDGNIQVHQSCVKLCPTNFPSGFYWYGGRRRGPGRPPKWVEELMEFSGDVAPQPLPAAEAETGIPPGAEPELNEERLDPPQLIRQSDRYSLRGRVVPPDQYH